MSRNRKPRKSLLNGWMPARTDTKSKFEPTSNSLTSPNASCSATSFRRRVAPASGADVDDVPLLGVDVVQVEHRRDPQRPVARPERRARRETARAMQTTVGSTAYCSPSPKNSSEPGILAAHTRRRRHLSVLENGLRHAGQDQEDVLADNRTIALERVLIVGVATAPLNTRTIAFRSGGISWIHRQPQPPPIGHRHEIRHPFRRGRRGRCGRRNRRAGNLHTRGQDQIDGATLARPERDRNDGALLGVRHRDLVVPRPEIRKLKSPFGVGPGFGRGLEHHVDGADGNAGSRGRPVPHGSGDRPPLNLRAGRRRRGQPDESSSYRGSHHRTRPPCPRTSRTVNVVPPHCSVSPSISAHGPAARVPLTKVPLTLRSSTTTLSA